VRKKRKREEGPLTKIIVSSAMLLIVAGAAVFTMALSQSQLGSIGTNGSKFYSYQYARTTQ
jgi:hypothetical protein